MSKAEKKERKKIWQKAYDQQPQQKEKRREASLAHAKQRKIINTMLRFESHTQDELLYIARLKCDELGINYELYETALKTAIVILGGSRNVQNDPINMSISDLQPNSL